MKWKDFSWHLVPFNDLAGTDLGEPSLNAEWYVTQLVETVERCDTPHHILFQGNWGAGKSTVLQRVQRHFENDPSRFVVVPINAWKHTKESLRRKLMLEVTDKVKPKASAMLRIRMYKSLEGLRAGQYGQFRFRWPNIKRAGILFTVMLGITAVVAAIQSLTIKDTTWAKSVGALLQTQLVVFLAPIILMELTTPHSPQDDHLLLTDSEQYESLFKAVITELQPKRIRFRKTREGRKLLVIIDDLDRCMPALVLETLETIKTFMNEAPCIFLVACDRLYVDSAVQRSLGSNGLDYLEKVFDTRISLLPYYRVQLVDYGKRLLDTHLPIKSKADVQPLMSEFGATAVRSGIIDRLVRTEIDTPRKVKRMINDFLVQCATSFGHSEGDVDLQSINWMDLYRKTIIWAKFPEVIGPFRENPDLPYWICRIGQNAAASLTYTARYECERFYKFGEDGSPDWRNPREEYQQLISFIQQEAPDHRSNGEHQGRMPSESEEALRARVIFLAEHGQYAELLGQLSEPTLADKALQWIVQASFDRARSEKPLLLALLHIGPSVHGAHNEGTIQTRYRLEYCFELFRPEEALWSERVLSNTLKFVREMGEQEAKRWYQMILDEAASPRMDQRVPVLISSACLDLLSSLPDPFHRNLSDILLRWVQTEAGTLALIDQVRHIGIILGNASGGLGGVLQILRTLADDPAQSDVLKTWIDAFSPALMAAEPDQFWETMLNLLQSGNPLLHSYLAGLVQGASDSIPPHLLEPLIESVVKGSNGDTAVQFLTAVLGRCGTNGFTTSTTVLEHLLKVSLLGHLNQTLAFIQQWENLWDADGWTLLGTTLVQTLFQERNIQRFVEIAKHLKAVSKHMGPTVREAYGLTLTELIREACSSAELVDVLQNHPTVLIPFALPVSTVSQLLDALYGLAFAQELSPQRAQMLLGLSALVGRVAPAEKQCAWSAQISAQYLRNNCAPELFQMGVDALCAQVRGVPEASHVAIETLDRLLKLVAIEPGNARFRGAVRQFLSVMPKDAHVAREKGIHAFLRAELDYTDLSSLLKILDVTGNHIDPAPTLVDAAVRHANHPDEYRRLENWVQKRYRRDEPHATSLAAIAIRRPEAHTLIRVVSRTPELRKRIIRGLVTVLQAERKLTIPCLKVLRDVDHSLTTEVRTTAVNAALDALSAGRGSRQELLDQLTVFARKRVAPQVDQRLRTVIVPLTTAVDPAVRGLALEVCAQAGINVPSRQKRSGGGQPRSNGSPDQELNRTQRRRPRLWPIAGRNPRK